jgi:hypothetical protein
MQSLLRFHICKSSESCKRKIKRKSLRRQVIGWLARRSLATMSRRPVTKIWASRWPGSRIYSIQSLLLSRFTSANSTHPVRRNRWVRQREINEEVAEKPNGFRRKSAPKPPFTLKQVRYSRERTKRNKRRGNREAESLPWRRQSVESKSDNEKEQAKGTDKDT